jgi:hypothetical protein
MRKFQVITIDHKCIGQDIKDKVITQDYIFVHGQTFLDDLARAGFKMYESGQLLNGALPTEILIEGNESDPIKKIAYDLANSNGLGKYVGHGAMYARMPARNKPHK